jgi:hypothetical protein
MGMGEGATARTEDPKVTMAFTPWTGNRNNVAAPQWAPEPRNTTEKVRRIILRSSHNEQCFR